MIHRRILQYPDQRLRKIAKPVIEVDATVRNLIREMAATMYAAQGIGLAATQIDVHWQIVVADVSTTRDQLHVLINPAIIDQGGSATVGEGCLSIADVYAKVTRSAWVTIGALDGDGKYRELSGDGVLAMCLQHELDHLNGILFIDYLHPRTVERLMRSGKRAT